MDAIRYLDADTILDYLHNSSETYLEDLSLKATVFQQKRIGVYMFDC